jgi:hypothetical protein
VHNVIDVVVDHRSCALPTPKRSKLAQLKGLKYAGAASVTDDLSPIDLSGVRPAMHEALARTLEEVGKIASIEPAESP